jgi:hypothetical protein
MEALDKLPDDRHTYHCSIDLDLLFWAVLVEQKEDEKERARNSFGFCSATRRK